MFSKKKGASWTYDTPSFLFSSNLNTQPSLISIVSPLGNKTNEMWTPTTTKIGEDVDSTYWGIPDLHIKA